MWIAIDIETYKQYDGTKESEDEIVVQMLTPDDKKKFREEKKKNYWYPVLNSREFTLGCAITETGEKQFFDNYKHMWSWLRKKIEENANNGKRTFIYGHNVEYDFYGIAKDDFLNEDLSIICYNPFFATWFCNGKRKDKKVRDNWGYFLDSYGFFRMPLSDRDWETNYR